MGIVEEVGSRGHRTSRPGDRVVVPFNISCGRCWMCDQRALLPVRDHPGARPGQGRRAVRLHQALRPGAGRAGGVPARAPGPLRADQGARRARRTSASSSSPTCCRRPGRPSSTPTPEGGTLAVFGLGPIGQMCAGSPVTGRGAVIGVDLVPERLARRAARRGGAGPRRGRRRRRGDPRADRRRGPDAVIDAVGHGGPRRRVGKPAQTVVGLLPDASPAADASRPGVDRLAALQLRRRRPPGGTVS